MSRTEDYLDSLLDSVSAEKKAEKIKLKDYNDDKKTEEKKQGRRGRDFLREFEKELEQDSKNEDTKTQDFLREFEKELEEEEKPLEDERDSGFFGKLENIVKGSKRNKGKKNNNGQREETKEQTLPEPMEDDIEEAPEKLEEDFFENIPEEVDTIGEPVLIDPEAEPSDFINTLDLEDELSVKENDPEEEYPEEDDFPEEDDLDMEEPDLEQEDEEQDRESKEQKEPQDKELMDILSQLPEDDELSGIGELLKSDDNSISLEEADAPVNLEEEDGGQKNKKGKEKGGFFAKLSRLLFGDEEEEKAESAGLTENADLENISDENLQILKELDEAEKADKEKSDIKKDQKEQKKKDKAEKRKQKKAEKEQKKKDKPKKEKKEKKPKVVDNSPPLPKGPVILIFIMAFSIVVFVVLSTNLLGYTVSMKAARDYYAREDYVSAYEELAGMKVKAADSEFYDKLQVLANVQVKFDSGSNLYTAKQYSMALDSLVCAVGRFEAGREMAEDAGIEKEYAKLEAPLLQLLTDKFGVDTNLALELYGLEDRVEYTKRLEKITADLGLE